MDPLEDPSLLGIRELELELIVHDVAAALSDRDEATLCTYLHPDVEYRPSYDHSARGIEAVRKVCAEIWESFDEFRVTPVQVAVRNDTVLVEQQVAVALAGSAVHVLMGFASYRFDGFKITEWRQLHA